MPLSGAIPEIPIGQIMDVASGSTMITLSCLRLSIHLFKGRQMESEYH